MNRIENLYEYQQAEVALEEIEAMIRSTPSRVQLVKLRGFLADQQKQLDKLGEDVVVAREQAAQVAERLQRLQEEGGRLKTQLEAGGVTTFSEAETLRKALEAMHNTITEDRRELYAIMQWTQKAGDAFSAVWAKATKAKKEFDALRETCGQELSSYQGKLDACKQAITAKAKLVDKDLMRKYQSIKSNNTQLPVALFANNQCGGCKLNLPMVVGHRLKNDGAVVECENCGRILYLPPE